MSLNALYVDFNSYFASVEQQLRPELRNKPVGVLAVMAETTCCIAASYEAKKFGVKTGTMVREARKQCPGIVFVEARPPVYVEYHHKLIALVESCTHVERVLSIDEMVCRLTGSHQKKENALKLAKKIKETLKTEAGEYIRCSIGIAPNVFLAKVASNMQKPDGCIVIEPYEIPEKLYALQLRDLNGIGKQMESRLNRYKIHTIEQLYAMNRDQLRAAWGSIEGERMFDKLRGLEPIYRHHARNSLGHSHVLPPEQRTRDGAKAVMHRLLQKACTRLRSYTLLTTTVNIKVKFRHQHSFKTEAHCHATDDTRQLIEIFEQLWKHYPDNAESPIAVGISFSGLIDIAETSDDLFGSKHSVNEKKLNQTLDMLNQKYGRNTIFFGGAYDALKSAPMRIAFNHIPNPVVESNE